MEISKSKIKIKVNILLFQLYIKFKQYMVLYFNYIEFNKKGNYFHKYNELI